MERRPPSYTSLKVKDLALSTHRGDSFCTNSSRPGLAMDENNTLAHAPHAPLCAHQSGVAWQGPQQEEFWKSTAGAGRRPIPVSSRWSGLGALRVRAMAGDAGGMGEAVSSAECQVAHGTGHGGTHMHWTVWTGRAVGKAFFRIRTLFVTAGAETRRVRG